MADGPAGGGPMSRRGLGFTVLLCLAGAGLALYAGTRTWLVEVTARPQPLPALRVVRGGGDLVAWLPPLAVVALAAAGALVATRGAARRTVGGLLVLFGVGLVGGGVRGLAALAGAGPATQATPAGAHPVWPALCLLGGVAVGVAGALTVLRGHQWPVMGARYDRGGAVPDRGNMPDRGGAVRDRGDTVPDRARAAEPGAAEGADARPAPAGRPAGAPPPVDAPQPAALWDALDRGEDLTAR